MPSDDSNPDPERAQRDDAEVDALLEESCRRLAARCWRTGLIEQAAYWERLAAKIADARAPAIARAGLAAGGSEHSRERLFPGESVADTGVAISVLGRWRVGLDARKRESRAGHDRNPAFKGASQLLPALPRLPRWPAIRARIDLGALCCAEVVR
jgi:hypothetical protein